MAAGALVIGLAGFISIRLMQTKPAEQSPGTRTCRAWSRELTTLTFYSLLMSAGASATLTYLPLYAVDYLHTSPRAAGAAVGVAGLLAIVGRVAWGRLTEGRVAQVRARDFAAACLLRTSAHCCYPRAPAACSGQQ